MQPDSEFDLWTEKYRPKTLSEIVGQKQIIDRLEVFVKRGIPNMLFAGPPGCGKCLTGETPILLSSGVIHPIQEIYEKVAGKDANGLVKNKKDVRIITLDSKGEFIPKKIDYVYKGKAKKLMKIKTRCGRILTVTPEHPFLSILDGEIKWLHASQLLVRNRISAPRHIKSFDSADQDIGDVYRDDKIYIKKGNQIMKFSDWKNDRIENDKFRVFYKGKYCKPSLKIKPVFKISEDFAKWLAMVMSEGSIEDSRIRFFNTNEKLLKDYDTLTNKLWDVKAIRLCRKGVPYLEIRKARTLSFILESLLKINVNMPKKSFKMHIPECIFKAPKNIKAAFIRTYFDCEGFVSKEARVELTTASKQIASGLQYLLLDFGIIGSIRKVKKYASNTEEKKSNYYYTLNISGSKELQIFNNKIGFSIKTKVGKLKRIINSKYWSTRDTIPYNIEWFRYIRNQLNVTSIPSWIFEKEKAGYYTLKKIIENLLHEAKGKIKLYLKIYNDIQSIESSVEELGGFHEFYSNYICKILTDIEVRKRVEKETGLRYDRTLDYAKGKREPFIDSLLLITKNLSCDQKIAHVHVQLSNVKKFKKIIDTAFKENILSYSEVATHLNMNSSNVINILRCGTEIKSITKLYSILTYIKNKLKNILNDERMLNILYNLQFLYNSNMFWDEIKEIVEIPGGDVYDLVINDTHNFIGGNFGPVVLHNTTAALCIARQLYGRNWRYNFLELNSSDERGIDVVRHKIKDFARTKPMATSYKILCLDEADSLTADAQHALRRTMEKYSKTSRFILICNYSSRIIEPIQSRCAIFRFRPLPREQAILFLNRIATGEKLDVEEGAYDALLRVSEGDMRRAVNIFQASATAGKITEATVYDMIAGAHPRLIREIITSALRGDFIDSRKNLVNMLRDGIAGEDIVKEIGRQVYELDIPETQKVRLIEKIGEFEYRMSRGGNAQIQLEALLAQFAILK